MRTKVYVVLDILYMYRVRTKAQFYRHEIKIKGRYSFKYRMYTSNQQNVYRMRTVYQRYSVCIAKICVVLGIHRMKIKGRYSFKYRMRTKVYIEGTS